MSGQWLLIMSNKQGRWNTVKMFQGDSLLDLLDEWGQYKQLF